MKKNYEDQKKLVELVNNAGGTYHKLNMGNGLIINGVYDMDKYLHLYGIPEKLDDLKVLDIGTSSGYFAIECMRRGGQVTAIDINDETCLPVALIERFGFTIRYIQKNIFDLNSAFGQFNLVICGSLLLHLSDPFRALERIRTVCCHQAIIATSCTSDSETNPYPACEFIGEHAIDGDYWHYWRLSAAALQKMALAAGFSKAETLNHFILQSEEGFTPFVVPHVIISAFV